MPSKKILILYFDVVTPVKSGAQQNLLNIMTFLKEAGFSIGLVSVYYFEKNSPEINRNIDNLYEIKNPLSGIILKLINKGLNFITLNPYKKNKVFTYLVRRKIKPILKNYDEIVINYVKFYDVIPKNIRNKSTLFTHELFYNYYDSIRRKNIFTKKYLNFLKFYEIKLLKQFSKLLVVAAYEKKELKSYINEDKIFYIGAPQEVCKISSNKKTHEFGFMGAHFIQNFDALKYFKETFFKTMPAANLLIAGAISNRVEVKKWVLENSNIDAIGHVEKVEDFYKKINYVVATNVYGSGIKVKILESMSYGKVVISTSIGLEGIPARHMKEVINVDELDGENFMLFLSKITTEMNRKIGENAQQFIKENFSTKALLSPFSESLKD